MLTIAQILAPQTQAQFRAKGVAILVSMGIPADRWAPGGVYSSMLTYSCQILAMLSGALANGLASFYLPTAVAAALASGDTGLLVLLSTYFYGVTVPTATFASGNLTLVNAGGGVYPVLPNALTFLNTKTNQTYTNPTGFTILATSSMTIVIQALQPGSVGNANPGDVTTMVTPLLGVTCTNPTSLVGTDAPGPLAIQQLCLASLGARSVRGPRSAFAYAILTAVNAVTGLPVNINRFTISTSSHTGTASIVIAGPAGTTDPNDLQGVKNSIEGLQGNPLTGARPECVTVIVTAAAVVPYAPTLTPYVLAPAGTSAQALQAAIETALTSFMSGQATNPIGGTTASDDTHASFTGLFAAGIYGAVAQGCATIGGCSLVSCKGATDMALIASQVAVDEITVNLPILSSPSS